MQKDLKSLQFVTRDESGAGQIAERGSPADARAKGRQGQSGTLQHHDHASNAGRLIDTLLQASQQGDMADHVSAPAPLLASQRPDRPDGGASRMPSTTAVSSTNPMSPPGPPASVPPKN
jgi:hypothetical protein